MTPAEHATSAYPLTIYSLLRDLGFSPDFPPDEAIRWALIELYLRRQEPTEFWESSTKDAITRLTLAEARAAKFEAHLETEKSAKFENYARAIKAEARCQALEKVLNEIQNEAAFFGGNDSRDWSVEYLRTSIEQIHQMAEAAAPEEPS